MNPTYITTEAAAFFLKAALSRSQLKQLLLSHEESPKLHCWKCRQPKLSFCHEREEQNFGALLSSSPKSRILWSDGLSCLLPLLLQKSATTALQLLAQLALKKLTRQVHHSFSGFSTFFLSQKKRGLGTVHCVVDERYFGEKSEFSYRHQHAWSR